MPRLYIRNKPRDLEVEHSSAIANVFFIEGGYLWRHGIDVIHYNFRSYTVCVVNDGKCWAVKTMRLMGNKQMRLVCNECDDESTKEFILMTDMVID